MPLRQLRQERPHCPQLAGSSSDRHTPSFAQFALPRGHSTGRHLPATQGLASHRFPQPPQLLGSVCVLTHVALGCMGVQSSCPSPQRGMTHAPARQVWLEGQATPHAPQFRRSYRVSVHLSPQSVCPAGQAHVPIWHVRPPEQFTPHMPQLPGSRCTSVHLAAAPMPHGRDSPVQASVTHDPATHR